MTKTPKLTDLDLVLLSAAAERDDQMVMPPPNTVQARGKTLERALAKLLRLGMIEECRAAMSDQAWRHEDGSGIALRITATGQAVLGLETSADSAEAGPDRSDNGDPAPATGSAAVSAPPGIRPGTKQARLVALLERDEGVGIDELVSTFGWQPHTVRAAITSLRKKGHVITSAKGGDGKTFYRATQSVTTADDAA